MTRSLALVLSALALLAGCQAEQPATVPVNVVGSPVPLPGADVVPDDTTKQLATVGLQAAEAIGAAVGQVAQLTGAYYDAKAQYTRYRVMSGPDGWEFRHGWYWRTDNSESRTLRAQFEDAGGVGALFDVTFDVNYGPDMHPGFPTELTQLRVECTQALPGNGQLAITLLAPLPASKLDTVSATGSGSVSAPSPVGSVGLEGLSAAFVPNNPAQSGVLVLKSLASSATYQFSGQYDAKGLSGTAKLIRNGTEVGEAGSYDGQWQVRNKTGNYPLK